MGHPKLCGQLWGFGVDLGQPGLFQCWWSCGAVIGVAMGTLLSGSAAAGLPRQAVRMGRLILAIGWQVTRRGYNPCSGLRVLVFYLQSLVFNYLPLCS